MSEFLLPRFLRDARRRAHALVLSGLLLAAPLVARAQPAPVDGNDRGAPVNPITVNGAFACDVPAGNITVNFSSGIEVFDGPTAANNIRPGAGDFQTILAGMTISVQVTTTPPFSGLNWAWMQAVTSYSSPTLIQRANGDALETPYADTPPGGYRFVPFGITPFTLDGFDNEPWYGNNVINQLSLYDQPRTRYSPVFGPTRMEFESWLVCVTQTGPAPGNYTVLPLVGFTWGFGYGYGQDANGNNNNVVGDDIREYTGVTHFDGFTSGGEPSTAFKDGYAKNWTINYLNNPEDCEDCLLTQAPEPGSLRLIGFLLAVGSCLLVSGVMRLRQEA